MTRFQPFFILIAFHELSLAGGPRTKPDHRNTQDQNRHPHCQQTGHFEQRKPALSLQAHFRS